MYYMKQVVVYHTTIIITSIDIISQQTQLYSPAIHASKQMSHSVYYNMQHLDGIVGGDVDLPAVVATVYILKHWAGYYYKAKKKIIILLVLSLKAEQLISIRTNPHHHHLLLLS